MYKVRRDHRRLSFVQDDISKKQQCLEEMDTKAKWKREIEK